MLKISKLSIALLFINIYVVFTLTGRYIPYGTLLFSAVSVISVVIDSKRNNFSDFISIKPEITTMLLFLFFCLISAPIVSYNSTVAISAIIEYTQKWIFSLIVFYICVKEKNIFFPIYLFTIIGCICAIIAVSATKSAFSRIELSENIGENGLGNLMVFSFFSVIYIIRTKKTLFVSFLGMLLLCVFVYCIMLTGSRKSLIAIVILVVLLFLYKVLSIKRIVSYKDFSVSVLLVISLIIIYRFGYPLFKNTSMYDRIFGRQAQHAAESNLGRISLYKTALKDFTNNPLFGIGFKNFSYKHGSYSHSVYAEILSCTGLVGFILYFYTYVRTGISLIRTTAKKKNDLDENYLILFMFLVFLFIGTGMGHMYDNISMMELGIFMAFVKIQEDKKTHI